MKSRPRIGAGREFSAPLRRQAGPVPGTNGFSQRHVNAAIFYNVWKYVQATGDLAFLREYGAEIMVEITGFWASAARFNPQRRRFEVHGVMGPDEFHDRYASAQEPGLRNNAYTNVMVAWLCGMTVDLFSARPDVPAEALRARLSISDEELRVWRDMSRRMFVPFHDDGIISQLRATKCSRNSTGRRTGRSTGTSSASTGS